MPLPLSACFKIKWCFCMTNPLRGQPLLEVQLYYQTFSSILQCLWRCVNGLRCPRWGTDWLRHSSSDSYEQTGTNNYNFLTLFLAKGKPVGLRARSPFSHARAARERILHPSPLPSVARGKPSRVLSYLASLATRNEVVARRLANQVKKN